MNEHGHEERERVLFHVGHGMALGEVDQVDFIPPETARRCAEVPVQPANDQHHQQGGQPVDFRPVKVFQVKHQRHGSWQRGPR